MEALSCGVLPCLESALMLHRAGLTLFPVKTDGSRAPKISKWQTITGNTPAELNRWFGGTDSAGIAVLGGKPSNDLLIFDFETVQAFTDFRKHATQAGLQAVVDAAPLLKTPLGGRHLYIRGPEAGGITKETATDPNQTTPKDDGLIAEARATRHYCVTGGSPVKTHQAGIPYQWIRLGWIGEGNPTAGTLKQGILPRLMDCFRLLNTRQRRYKYSSELESNRPLPPLPTIYNPPDESLIGAFNRENRLTDLLLADGWKPEGANGDRGTRWTRPGKDKGCSATVSHDGAVVFNFSSSAGIETEKALDAFEYYAQVKHQGDKSKALKAWQASRPDPKTAGYFTNPGNTPPRIPAKQQDWQPLPGGDVLLTSRRLFLMPWGLIPPGWRFRFWPPFRGPSAGADC
jgi:hypothetical protein